MIAEKSSNKTISAASRATSDPSPIAIPPGTHTCGIPSISIGPGGEKRKLTVGRLERGRVVHPVACHRDDAPAPLELVHDPQLLLGGRPREDDLLVRAQPLDLRGVQPVEFGPGDHDAALRRRSVRGGGGEVCAAVDALCVGDDARARGDGY